MLKTVIQVGKEVAERVLKKCEELEKKIGPTPDHAVKMAWAARKAYSHSTDSPLPEWDKTKCCTKRQMHDMALKIFENPSLTAHDLHEEWRKSMAEKGWSHGEYDPVKKTCPSVTSFEELTGTQRTELEIFVAVIQAAAESKDSCCSKKSSCH